MDKLTQFMNACWVLESKAQTAELAYIMTAIKTSNVAAIENYLSRDKITAYATANINAVNQYELSDVNIPDNSIAVISVQGLLYSWKTFEIENYIKQSISNPRIVAILLFVNTPGGMAHRVDIASDLIKQSPKPINAYVTGMCCSGGIWLVSGCKHIMAASVMDIIGSIGVKTNFYSLKKYLKDLGVEDRDVYATDSTQKDYESRQAEQGNDTPIIEDLDFVNNLFQTTISQNMGITLDKTADLFQGATFNAQEAMQNKLVHSIGTFEDLMRQTLAAGLAVKSKQQY